MYIRMNAESQGVRVPESLLLDPKTNDNMQEPAGVRKCLWGTLHFHVIDMKE